MVTPRVHAAPCSTWAGSGVASTFVSMAVAALVVSVLALATSVVAYWRQDKWAKVAASADAQLARIEQARHSLEVDARRRAVLVVRVEPAGTDGHLLVVANEGPDAASDVTVALTSRAAGDAPGLMDSPFPATIVAGAETSAHLDESLATSTLVTADVRWVDGAGDQRQQVGLTLR